MRIILTTCKEFFYTLSPVLVNGLKCLEGKIIFQDLFNNKGRLPEILQSYEHLGLAMA